MAANDFDQLIARLEALNKLLDLSRTKIQELGTVERSSQAIAALNQELQVRNKISSEILRATELLQKQATSSKTSSYIPGGASSRTTATDPYAAFRSSRKDPLEFTPIANTNSGSTGLTQMTLFGEAVKEDIAVEKKTVSSKQKLLSEREVAEQQRITTLRESIAADAKYANALNIAAEKGFAVSDLKNVYNRGTDINRLQFQKTDKSGIRQDLDLYVNQSGKATPGISNQFRSFTGGVVRDIGELTKWSIALAAVYGPLQKVGELTQEMIANQTKLATATITVNSAFLSQSDIFSISADAADRSGEAITGVIDAFTLAYRATGGVGNETTRLAAAQKLLSDSLTLSKLSALDQASAIDTLAAAVRQTGGDFNGTTKLLDSWVRVTKVANVDMATLATGFATVGDAAETAGLSADDLNGILAVLAESTNQTGQEVANTSRAIIAGFQSDQGKKSLEELGIAVTDSTGKMRDLKDVMQEVAALRSKGIISSTQLSQLGLSIGGGSRRGAAVTTFIENYSRALEVSKESAAAGGDAQAALAKQLDTVQTSVTKLANSFTTLAQTLGTEGGFLSIIKSGTDASTILVKTFDALVSVLGKATPALAAFIATSLILKSRGVPSIQSFVGSLAQNTPTPTGPDGQQFLPGFGPQLTGGQKFGNFASSNLLGTNASSGAFQGLIASLLPAMLNATNKEDRFGGVKAGADVVGGISGGIIGSLTGAGPIIGATIGTAISEAFVNSTIARKVDFLGFGKEATLGEKNPGTGNFKGDTQAALDTAVQGLYKSIGGGSEAIGKFITSGQEKIGQSIVERINDAIKGGNKEDLTKALTVGPRGQQITEQQLQGLGLSTALIKSAFEKKQQIDYAPERAAYLRATPEARSEYDKALSARTAQGDVQSIDTAFTKMLEQNKTLYDAAITGIKESGKSQISGERLTGKVKGTEYASQLTSLGGFDVKALEYFTAFGKEFQKTNKDIKNSTDAFTAFKDVVVYGTQESVGNLTEITGEIENIINLLSDPKLNADTLKTQFGGEQQARNKLKELQQTAGNLATDIYQQAQLGRTNVPQIRGTPSQAPNTKDFQLVLQRAAQYQDQFYKGFLKLPDQLYDGLKKSWDDWAQVIDDSGNVFYQSVSGVSQDFVDKAQQALEKEGKINTQKNDFGIQQVDLPGSKAGELQGTVDYFSKYLATNFKQYQQKPEDIGVIFNDYVTGTLHGDNLAIKLALEKLVNINQKQLDGQYNIPEGATFWVPLTAAYYRNKDNSGVDTSGLDASAGNLDDAASNLKTAADYIKYSFDNPHMSRPPITTTPGTAGGKEQPLSGSQVHTEAIRDSLNQQRYDTGEQIRNRKSEEAGYGVPSAKPAEQGATNSFSSFIDLLKSLLVPKTQTEPGGYRGFGDDTKSFSGSSGQQTAQPAPQPSKLDLKLSATTNLTLDGRLLAQALQTYLASDLIKTEGTQGTVTKRYII